MSVIDRVPVAPPDEPELDEPPEHAPRQAPRAAANAMVPNWVRVGVKRSWCLVIVMDAGGG
jgi:hypothetical protein